jgi:hypothetical protein
MTELGCSSSSELSFWTLIAAFLVSSCCWLDLSDYFHCYDVSGRTRKSIPAGLGLSLAAGLHSGSNSGSNSGSSASRPKSSMSVVSVPFDDGAIGDGSGILLGLDASGEGWCGG